MGSETLSRTNITDPYPPRWDEFAPSALNPTGPPETDDYVDYIYDFIKGMVYPDAHEWFLIQLMWLSSSLVSLGTSWCASLCWEMNTCELLLTTRLWTWLFLISWLCWCAYRLMSWWMRLRLGSLVIWPAISYRIYRWDYVLLDVQVWISQRVKTSLISS